MPLPCARGLWGVSCTHEWIRRYRDIEKRRKSDRVLTVGDIRDSIGRLDVKDLNQEREIDLLSWCKDIDNYGIIVWTAATL